MNETIISHYPMTTGGYAAEFYMRSYDTGKEEYCAVKPGDTPDPEQWCDTTRQADSDFLERIDAEKAPVLDFARWLEDHYPVPAAEFKGSDLEACHAAHQKWSGLRPEVLKRYGLTIVVTDSVPFVVGHERELKIGSGSCTLCHRVSDSKADKVDCEQCPVWAIRSRDCNTEWWRFRDTGDPEPMIALLAKAIEHLEAKEAATEKADKATSEPSKGLRRCSNGSTAFFRRPNDKRVIITFWSDDGNADANADLWENAERTARICRKVRYLLQTVVDVTTDDDASCWDIKAARAILAEIERGGK